MPLVKLSNNTEAYRRYCLSPPQHPLWRVFHQAFLITYSGWGRAMCTGGRTLMTQVESHGSRWELHKRAAERGSENISEENAEPNRKWTLEPSLLGDRKSVV